MSNINKDIYEQQQNDLAKAKRMIQNSFYGDYSLEKCLYQDCKDCNENITDKTECQVYKFSINPDIDLLSMYKWVYVKPFHIDEEDDETYHPDPREDMVKNAYFTQERIDELKRELIRRIEESNCPFTIFCSDYDEYSVSNDKEILEIK